MKLDDIFNFKNFLKQQSIENRIVDMVDSKRNSQRVDAKRIKLGLFSNFKLLISEILSIPYEYKIYKILCMYGNFISCISHRIHSIIYLRL
jgi:hypothetical protein